MTATPFVTFHQRINTKEAIQPIDCWWFFYNMFNRAAAIQPLTLLGEKKEACEETELTNPQVLEEQQLEQTWFESS